MPSDSLLVCRRRRACRTILDMPLLPAVGRRSARVRLALTVIYVLLCLGAATTLYPFAVMLGASITSDYDQNDYSVVPAYLRSGDALAAKYALDKYNADVNNLNAVYGTAFTTLQSVKIAPDTTPGASQRVARWRAFFDAQPMAYKTAGFRGLRGAYVPSKLLNRYRQWLQEKYHGGIGAVGHAYTEEDTSFLSVQPPLDLPQQRTWQPGMSPKDLDWTEFQRTIPAEWFQPVRCDAFFQGYLRDTAYPSGKIADVNAAWGTRYASFADVVLPATVPSNAAEAKDWTGFVRKRLPLRFIAWQPGATPEWAAFLAGQKDVPAAQKLTALPDALHPGPSGAAVLPNGPALRSYAAFVAQANPKLMRIASLEGRWRDQVNDPDAALPVAESDREYAASHAGELRREFMARNYRFAADYLLLHGRGVWNTVIYCVGAVLTAIIVNPLCAYALSRFKLPYGTGLLLFLLATMAFPAEVTLIPNFLLLKQLGLLNTYWALILPGAASGFSIFLLKGFFDSLPPELYEAATLDGASDITLFTRVTIPLSGPIFAVIALQAFAGMYGAFLFALTIEQAQSQWPLMVWIYEFQALAAPSYVMMAALVIAALPTLIVFLFAQNVIMRGVILPSYK